MTRDKIDRGRTGRKLGRGLSEVSHIFLSGAERRMPKVQEGEDGALWMPDAAFVCVTSGEKVRGKTFMAANLAFGLSLKGRKVAIVNADSERPDILDITGAAPQEGALALARTNKAFGNILAADISRRLDHGLAEGEDVAQPLREIEAAAHQAGMVIIDTSPWAEPSRNIWRLARLVIVLTEPTAERMKGSYVTIKRVRAVSSDVRIGLVVNMVRGYAEAERCFRKISGVCRRFLKTNLRNYGFIVHNAVVSEACERAEPLTQAFPESKVARCLDSILGLMLMDESAIAKRRMEVTI